MSRRLLLLVGPLLLLTGCALGSGGSTASPTTIPAAFWEAAPVSRPGWGDLFPHQTGGSRSCAIPVGTSKRTAQGKCSTEIVPLTSSLRQAVPASERGSAWGTVLLIETWSGPLWKGQQSAIWNLVIDTKGTVLFTRPTGYPPQWALYPEPTWASVAEAVPKNQWSAVAAKTAGVTSLWRAGSIAQNDFFSWDPYYVWAGQSGTSTYIATRALDVQPQSAAKAYAHRYVSPQSVPGIAITGVSGQVVSFSGASVRGTLDLSSGTWSYAR